jgi:glyoxylase-like metal-dependent hydrolase (beta-lactamase superfamily II)
MSIGGPSYRVLAVRYAERETTLADAYYRWSSYGEPDGPLDMSYYFWVLWPLHEPEASPIVIDCGFDPQLGRRMGRRCLCEPAEALARVGVAPAAVQRLVISHMHYDHIGNVDLFADARITVARDELSFWTTDPVAERPQFALHTDPGGVQRLRRAADMGRVDEIGQRAEIAPGLMAIQVGGHAPGQLVFEVAGEHGALVLANDAVHYEAELQSDRPFGIFSDLGGMYRGYDTVRALMGTGATLVPGHDPLVMERFPPVDGDAHGIAVCLTEEMEETS